MIQNKVSESLHDTAFIDMIEKLAKGELYSMKISSAALFPRSYAWSEVENWTWLYGLFLGLCWDDTPMVWRAAAAALGDFVEAMDTMNDEIIEAFKKFMTDA